MNTADAPADNVDELNDVYLTNLANVRGQEESSVAAFSPEGKPIQRFSAPGLKEASAIAVDSESGEVYVADAASDELDVFALEAPGEPKLDGLSSEQLSSEANAVELHAQVDPSGSDAHAYFEYGAVSCAENPSSCARTAEVNLGESFADQPASIGLQDLQPGTYHYRVFARNADGAVASPEGTFSIAATLSGLPDGRAWELVSPVENGGAEPEAITREGGAIQAAANGDAIAYVADGPLRTEGAVEGTRNPEFTQVVSVRVPSGWVSQDISTSNLNGSGIHVGRPPEYQLFSSDLALALLEPYPGGPSSGSLAEPPLSPPLEFELEGNTVREREQEKTIYERDDAPIEPQASDTAERQIYEDAQRNGSVQSERGLPGVAGYLALVSEANALGVLGGSNAGGAPFGGGEAAGVEVLDASEDLSHVVLKSYKADPGLYEWGPTQKLQLVSELPEGAPTQGNLGGPEGHDAEPRDLKQRRARVLDL